MLFIIIENKNKEIFKTEFYEDNLREIVTPTLRSNYIMMSVSTHHNIILKFLRDKNIKANFVLPLLSASTFKEIYGLQVLTKLKLIPVNYIYSEFEDIIAPINGLYPEHLTKYIYLNDLERVKLNKVPISTIEKINREIAQEGLYIDSKEYKIKILDVFEDSMRGVIKSEISQQDTLTKTINIRNNQYFLLVIADFILDANNYFTKEEIKNFLMSEILQDN